MEDVSGVVHTVLEGAVEMGEGLCAAAEAHALAEVIATLFAITTVIAHDTSLDGDSLAHHEVLDTGAYGRDDAACFVTQDQGRLQHVVAISAVHVVMHCKTRREF